MEAIEAYPITYGVLGLLAFWGPLSGYDLKHLSDHVLAPMWGAAQSQIYKELRRMQALGWVEMKREEQESRPARKVYSITDAGHAALQAWQARPAEIFQVRDELLLKVLFGAFAAPGDLVQNLQASIAEHELRLLSYRQNAQYVPARGTFQRRNKRPNPYAAESQQDDPYVALIARFAIEFEKTYIHWLYEAVEVLTSYQQPTLHDAHEPG